MINIFKAPEEPKKVVEEKIQISITKREKQQVTEPVAKGITSSSQNGAVCCLSQCLSPALALTLLQNIPTASCTLALHCPGTTILPDRVFLFECSDRLAYS